MLRIKWSRLLSEHKGAARRSGISASQKKRSRAPAKRSAKARAPLLLKTKRRDALDFDEVELNCAGFSLSLTYLPSGDPFSRRRPQERSLTGGETKTPQPRCSARPRPPLLKGQYTGKKGGGGRSIWEWGVGVGRGVRLAHMASSPPPLAPSCESPPRIHALNFQTGERRLH